MSAPDESTRFDEYRLVRLLGRGAMGEVFLAEDEVLGRPVALKLLGDAASQRMQARVLDEARAAARLAHPNVATVYRVGEHQGRPYIASEFVHGMSLDQLVRPVVWSRLLEIGIGLARGLGAAHRRGVLHRDVKPANAMLADDGTVKLVDFGLATLTDIEAELAATVDVVPLTTQPGSEPVSSMDETASFVPPELAGEVSHAGIAPRGARTPDPQRGAGTPRYMAPEVWRHEPATRRSDVYSLGALLYELASGEAPHKGDSLLTLSRSVREEDARALTALAPDIEPRFAAIVHRCLARDAASRPASGDEVRELLEGLAATVAGEAAAEGAARRALPAGNPYRGLASFDAAHRELFFGRSRDTAAVVDRLRGEALVIVAGDSGVGKSSLCRAGVLPQIESGALGDRRTWTALAFLPGRRPLLALAAALCAAGFETEAELAEDIVSEPAAVSRRLRAWLGTGAAGRGLLILVDASEELLTQSDPAEAAAVGRMLAELAAIVTSVRVLMTVRGDFVTRLARLSPLGSEVGRALHILRPLDDEGLHAAVAEPARAHGVSFSPPDLVETLARAARTDGALPLLQFALAELWETRDRSTSEITAASLEALGGVDGALARHAERVVTSLLPEPRAAARRILVSLVTREGTRSRRLGTELTGSRSPDDDDDDDASRAARTALEALVRGRLVVARDDPEGPAYELAHEALIVAWASLREWLGEDGGRRVIAERLDRAAAEWERLGHAPDALWGARQLDEARVLDHGDLSQAARTFVRASQKALRAARLRRILAVGAVPVLIGGVVAAVRIQSAREIGRAVAADAAVARTALDGAHAADADAARFAKESYALFDGHDRAKGEDSWKLARRAREQSERLLGQAGRAAESALLRDASRADSRSLLADVMFERALHAEFRSDTAETRDALERLAIYDADGSRRARWAAPGLLELTTVPPDAAVIVERFDEDAEHAGTWARLHDTGSSTVSHPLPAGSYRLRLTHADHAPVLFPFVLARSEHLAVSVTLPAAGAVPQGFVYVPAGRFLTGSPEEDHQRKDNLKTSPIHHTSTGAYLIAATETTFGEWITYLDALPEADRTAATPHATSVGVQGDVGLTHGEAGWQIRLQPASKAFVAHAGEPVTYPRDHGATQDWLRMPVAGVSFHDAEAYAAWLSQNKKLPGARLCTEEEWERAARGADGRMYPHGQRVLPDDVNHEETYGAAAEAHGPDEVGSHPASDSPFGVHDMAGNVFELVRTEGELPGVVIVRGGAFAFDQNAVRTELRERTEPDLRDITIGVRICADAPR